MIPNDQPLRSQTIKRMIDYCMGLAEREELTKWETDFITSLDSQFIIKNDLSSKQCEILERLYDQ